MESSKPTAFIGLNLNLDAKVAIHDQDNYQRMCDLIARFESSVLEPFEDCVHKSVAKEVLVCKEFMESVIREFTHELVLGGQEGFFFDNAAACFKEECNLALHFPCRAKSLIDFMMAIEPNALVFDGEEAHLKPLTEVETDPTQGAPIHIIAEYPAGLSLTHVSGPHKGETFITERANRFILTFDPIQAKLELDPFMLRGIDRAMKESPWYVLISGYHLLRGSVVTPEFETIHEDLFKKLHDGARFVHYEFASTEVPEVQNLIYTKILPQCHSIGLNEQELETMGKFILKDEWPEDSNYLEKCRILMSKLKSIHTVFFHAPSFYLQMSDPVKAGLAEGASVFDPEKVIAAMKRAESIIITRRSVSGSETFLTPLPPNLAAVLPESGCGSLPGVTYVSYRPKMIKPISSTVGLGDTISSSLVLGVLLGLDKK